MKRFLLSISIVIILIFAMSMLVSASKDITLKLDGKVINTDVKPCIVDSRTLIPARALFEELGATVNWDAETREVKVDYDGTEVLLEIGSKTALVSNEKKEMDVAALIIEDRTMIPVRFVAENLGFTVDWDAENYIVNVVPAEKYSYSHYVKTVYSESYENATVITVKGAGKAQVTKSTLENPTRLVFDFSDTRLEVVNPVINCDDEFLSTVRLGQFDKKTTRVVLDVKDDVDYTLSAESKKDDYIITIHNKNYKPEEDKEDDVSTGEKIVFIDAGHGGSEVGTIGKLYKEQDFDLLDKVTEPEIDKEFYEKDINLKIALKVNKLLEKAGIKTCMLRTTDKYVNIYDRPKIANKENAYLYLSIHNNASTSASVHGTQVYYSESMPSFESMTNEEMANIYYDEITETTGLRRAGVVDNPRYIVINQTEMPALILEIAFLSNQEDLKKMLDDKFLDKAAKGISEATVKVMKKTKDDKIIPKVVEKEIKDEELIEDKDVEAVEDTDNK